MSEILPPAVPMSFEKMGLCSAVIVAAAASWARAGAPLDAAAVACLWAAVSGCAECRPCQPLQRWLPAMICEHIFVIPATIAVALFMRKMPFHDQITRSCACLVGEVVCGLLKWAAASEDSAQNRQPVPDTEEHQSLLATMTHVEPRQNEAATPPCVHSMASDNELATAQFEAAYRMTIALFGSMAVLLPALAVGDPGARGWILSALPNIVVSMLMRMWLHTMQDQRRARLLCGRCLVMMAILRQIITSMITFIGTVSPVAFVATRFMHVLVHTYSGYHALHLAHRLAWATTIAAGSFVHPEASEIGFPLEPIITSSSVLVGVLLGSEIGRASCRERV